MGKTPPASADSTMLASGATISAVPIHPRNCHEVAATASAMG
jgi:hypothetical protein